MIEFFRYFNTFLSIKIVIICDIRLKKVDCELLNIKWYYSEMRLFPIVRSYSKIIVYFTSVLFLVVGILVTYVGFQNILQSNFKIQELIVVLMGVFSSYIGIAIFRLTKKPQD